MYPRKKIQHPLSEDEKTQLIHKKVRIIRDNPEALSDLPIELFLRLVGLFFTIPHELREASKYRSITREFENLRLFIDTQLASDDGKNFAKYEMADYVHNLYLLLIGVVQLDFLEANLHNIREEYRGHVSDQAYKVYLSSKLHEFITKYCCYAPDDPEFIKIKDIYEDRIRLEYRNLVNEIRRARLFEEHIEDTRGYLMRGVAQTFLWLIALPVLILLCYGLFIWYVYVAGSHHAIKTYQDIYSNYLNPASNYNSSNNWFNGVIGIVLICLAAIAGATGSLISALLRIQGVRDNSQLAQNIVAFKYSENAIRMAPLTGLIFGIVLSLIFVSGLAGGALFPGYTNSWTDILFENDQLAKWLVWCFIAGFSERLVPDMVDRLADKARKSEEK